MFKFGTELQARVEFILEGENLGFDLAMSFKLPLDIGADMILVFLQNITVNKTEVLKSKSSRNHALILVDFQENVPEGR